MYIIFKAVGVNYSKIAKFLKLNSLIVYPTDTVYGVAARIESEDALIKLYAAKSRSFTSPLIALVDKMESVFKVAEVPNFNYEKFKKLTDKFWPGGLTIILKKLDSVPGIMVSHGDTVGVRMPNHEVALNIIEAAGGVLPTTSANISGGSTPKSYNEISEDFMSKVDIVIDGGDCPVGLESTIIDLSSKNIKNFAAIITIT